MPLSTDNKVFEIPFQPSTLENIDYAVYEWLRDSMDIHTNTNKGWKKVSTIWISAERAQQIKKDKSIRDDAGAIILPVLTMERTSVSKDLKKKGTFQAALPAVNDAKGGVVTIARQINQEKTLERANADAFRGYPSSADPSSRQINFVSRGKKTSKIVYETITMPIPVYLDINYLITVRTEYQEQMNDIITPFTTRTGGINSFALRRDGHLYEAFIQQDLDVANNISNLAEEERQYITKINVKVLGYIMGADKNDIQPRLVRRQNAVQVRIPRERVGFGDIPEHGNQFVGGSTLKAQERALQPFKPAKGTPLAPPPRASRSEGGGVTGFTVSGDATKTLTIERAGLTNLTASFTDNTGSAATTVTGEAISDKTIYRETPTGNINGSNKAFTTSVDIITGSELVFVNGMLMRDGSGYDYNMTADDTITFNDAPYTNSYILVTYVKKD